MGKKPKQAMKGTIVMVGTEDLRTCTAALSR
jgi:hypothetical protein